MEIREWCVSFRTMERKDRGKEIILDNGGKITEAHQNGIWYVLWYWLALISAALTSET